MDKSDFCFLRNICAVKMPSVGFSSLFNSCDSADCRPYAEKYAEDQNVFFSDYSESHVKLSEAGAKFVDDAPVVLS